MSHMLSYQSCKSGWVFRVGSDWGLSLPKCFGTISGLHAKPFYSIQSNVFFLTWGPYIVLTAVASVREAIVIFLQLIPFANTDAFGCYLLQLDPHCFWEGDNGNEISTLWHYVEEINHLRDSWLVLRNDGLKTSLSCEQRYPR